MTSFSRRIVQPLENAIGHSSTTIKTTIRDAVSPHNISVIVLVTIAILNALYYHSKYMNDSILVVTEIDFNKQLHYPNLMLCLPYLFAYSKINTSRLAWRYTNFSAIKNNRYRYRLDISEIVLRLKINHKFYSPSDIFYPTFQDVYSQCWKTKYQHPVEIHFPGAVAGVVMLMNLASFDEMMPLASNPHITAMYLVPYITSKSRTPPEPDQRNKISVSSGNYASISMRPIVERIANWGQNRGRCSDSISVADCKNIVQLRDLPPSCTTLSENISITNFMAHCINRFEDTCNVDSCHRISYKSFKTEAKLKFFKDLIGHGVSYKQINQMKHRLRLATSIRSVYDSDARQPLMDRTARMIRRTYRVMQTISYDFLLSCTHTNLTHNGQVNVPNLNGDLLSVNVIAKLVAHNSRLLSKALEKTASYLAFGIRRMSSHFHPSLYSTQLVNNPNTNHKPIPEILLVYNMYRSIALSILEPMKKVNRLYAEYKTMVMSFEGTTFLKNYLSRKHRLRQEIDHLNDAATNLMELEINRRVNESFPFENEFMSKDNNNNENNVIFIENHTIVHQINEIRPKQILKMWQRKYYDLFSYQYDTNSRYHVRPPRFIFIFCAGYVRLLRPIFRLYDLDELHNLQNKDCRFTNLVQYTQFMLETILDEHKFNNRSTPVYDYLQDESIACGKLIGEIGQLAVNSSIPEIVRAGNRLHRSIDTAVGPYAKAADYISEILQGQTHQHDLFQQSVNNFSHFYKHNMVIPFQTALYTFTRLKPYLIQLSIPSRVYYGYKGYKGSLYNRLSTLRDILINYQNGDAEDDQSQFLANKGTILRDELTMVYQSRDTSYNNQLKKQYRARKHFRTAAQLLDQRSIPSDVSSDIIVETARQALGLNFDTIIKISLQCVELNIADLIAVHAKNNKDLQSWIRFAPFFIRRAKQFSNSRKISPEFLSKNILQVHLFYETLQVEKKIDTRVLDLSQYLSTLGSVGQLYVGFELFNILQLICFVISLTTTWLNATKSQQPSKKAVSVALGSQKSDRNVQHPAYANDNCESINGLHLTDGAPVPSID